MRNAALFALAGLLLAGGCRQGVAPAPEYRPDEAGTVDHAMCLLGFSAIPLREVATGHHLVQVTINGESGPFVLDTGANATVVDESHLRRFGISGQAVGLGGAIGVGGGRRARQVAIDNFEIGAADIRQSRVVAADLGGLLTTLSRISGRTVYGIVGQDVLKEHRALIDVARPMLYLMEEDRDPAPVPAEQCRRAEQETS